MLFLKWAGKVGLSFMSNEPELTVAMSLNFIVPEKILHVHPVYFFSLSPEAFRMIWIWFQFLSKQNTKDSILPVIQKYMKNFLNDYTLINIQGETWTHEIKNMVTIVCDDDVSYCGVLSQALTDHNKPATYVVSSRSLCRRNDSGEKWSKMFYSLHFAQYWR